MRRAILASVQTPTRVTPRRFCELPAPSAIVVVVDASNLQRNLYYATQVIELGHPTLIALNMTDVAEENGHHIDAGKLAGELGVPVLPMVASTGQGIAELRQAMLAALQAPPVLAATSVCVRISFAAARNVDVAGAAE